MNDLGNRLDALAAEATASVALTDPSRRGRATVPARTRRPSLAPPRIAFGVGLASLIVVIGLFAWWQVRSEPSSSLVVASEPASMTTGECSTPSLTQLLGAGVPDDDYDRATSYTELADQSAAVVSGKVTSAQRVTVNGREYVELSVVDVLDPKLEPRPDIDIVAYEAAWPAEAGGADPLDGGLAFEEVVFMGFLSPWSGVRDGWAPGRQGLYVACASDQAVEPVIDTAEGPMDPRRMTTALWGQSYGSDPTGVDGPPPRAPQVRPCSAATIAATMAATNAIFDPLPYPLASSYNMLAKQAHEIVSGNVTSLRKIVIDGQVFAEFAVTDAVDISGAPRPEIAAIVYQIPRPFSAGLRNVPSEGWAFEDMGFVGFLGPVAGAEDVPTVRTPGPQGLYLTCGDDDPLAPVVESAAGPDDPKSVTVTELLALVTDG